MAFGNEVVAKRSVVIELAVVREPACLILVGHRLGSGGRKIHDGKSAMSKTEVAFEVESFSVGPAMSEGASHANEEVAINGPVRFGVVEDACDSAHRVNSAFV